MKVLIFHASAGHGHKKVAEVLGRTFVAKGLRKEDVQVIDALDLTPWLFRTLYPATYFYAVKYIPGLWGWFYEWLDKPAVYSALRWLRSLQNRLQGGKLLRCVETENPDLILCTHFFSAELLATAKKQGRISAKLITVLTDFLPHTFWVNNGTDLYSAMGEEGKASLLKRGIPEDRIIVTGIPVDAAFKPTGRKSAVRQAYGFSDSRLTVLLTSGSFGLGHAPEILDQLGSFADNVQCFMVCGQNNALKTELERRTYKFPVKVFGFVDFMADLMEASDLIVAKPGGSTTTESLAKRLPMVIMDPIPGQESRNADILKSRQASFSIGQPDEIQVILKAIFAHSGLMAEKQKAIDRLARPNAAEDVVKYSMELLSKTPA